MTAHAVQVVDTAGAGYDEERGGGAGDKPARTGASGAGTVLLQQLSTRNRRVLLRRKSVAAASWRRDRKA